MGKKRAMCKSILSVYKSVPTILQSKLCACITILRAQFITHANGFVNQVYKFTHGFFFFLGLPQGGSVVSSHGDRFGFIWSDFAILVRFQLNPPKK